MKLRRGSVAKSYFRSGLMSVASRVLDDPVLETDDEVDLRPAEEPGPALGVDGRGGVVQDAIDRQPGDVATMAVGVAGDDAELLASAGLVEPGVAGLDGQVDQGAVRLAAVASGAPSAIQASRVLYESEPAASLTPPAWGTRPVAFWTRRLFAGSRDARRRPPASRVSER